MDRLPALSRRQVRELDRIAIEELGIPGVVLMENAGRGAAEAILALMRERALAGSVAIVCGRGNNGGDGYVVARHLHAAGLELELLSACPGAALAGDALTMRTIAVRMRLALRDCDAADAAPRLARSALIVDGLLGTGFEGELRADALAWVRAQNAAPGVRVALDLPSGLDCDLGRPAPEAVRAELTVTFAAPKIGFARPEAAPFLGRVVVAGIGAPPELALRVQRT